MVADAAQKSKGGIKAPLIEVVKKQAAHAPGFVAMLEVKVVITPALEARIDLGPERLAGVGCGLVPMPGIFKETVVWGQIEPPAHPPDRLLVGSFGDEQADIGVCGGNVGVLGVDHQ